MHRTMIGTWLCDLFLHQLEVLQSNSRNDSSTKRNQRLFEDLTTEFKDFLRTNKSILDFPTGDDCDDDEWLFFNDENGDDDDDDDGFDSDIDDDCFVTTSILLVHLLSTHHMWCDMTYCCYQYSADSNLCEEQPTAPSVLC